MDPAPTVLINHQIAPFLIEATGRARRRIIIVSPYVKPWGHIQEALLAARDRGVATTLYYRKGQEAKQEAAVIARCFTRATPVRNLHAKIYCFDGEIVVSSMNLYEFSSAASKEIALRVVDAEQRRMIEAFIEAELAPAVADSLGSTAAEGPVQDLPSQASTAADGHCIRCGAGLSYGPEFPLCDRCFRMWKRYSNPEHTEKFCHACGKKAKTSLLKPLCYACYKGAVPRV
ncbi:MAG TPA: phospholipase D-like domain-containing protein [bacterium]|nr:phospholipase D-like domain-containing protein [bacterium]